MLIMLIIVVLQNSCFQDDALRDAGFVLYRTRYNPDIKKKKTKQNEVDTGFIQRHFHQVK